MKLQQEIDEYIKTIQPVSRDELQASRKRWLKLSNGNAQDEPDYLPIIVNSIDPACAQEKINPFQNHHRSSLLEQLENPEKMLYEQLASVKKACRFPSDGIPSVSIRHGNAFLGEAFEVPMRIVADTTYTQRYLTVEEIERIDLPDDLTEIPIIKNVVEFLRYCQSVLPEHVSPALYFMMSPYDLAFMLRGEQLILDMYDNPHAVHLLMRKTTDLFVRATRLFKKVIDESYDGYLFTNSLFSGGGHLCEDSCILLSPELHEQFSLPYTIEALDELNGGWVHFCGDGRQLLGSYLALPNMFGINYGQMGLNGPRDGTLKRFMQKGKACNFALAKEKNEAYPAYFRRILSHVDRRKFFYLQTGASAEDRETGQGLRRLWQDLQDELILSRNTS